MAAAAAAAAERERERGKKKGDIDLFLNPPLLILTLLLIITKYLIIYLENYYHQSIMHSCMLPPSCIWDKGWLHVRLIISGAELKVE